MRPFPPPGAAIEVVPSLVPRPETRLIVFDFDGTLSWLRHGWPGMMVDTFTPYFPPLPGKTVAETRAVMLGEILALNGQPSIRQCLRFTEMAQERGGTSPDAETLRDQFQARLDAAIERRVERLHRGEVPPTAYAVHGVHSFLEYAQSTGRILAILSTTVQERVEVESQLLGLRRYFGRHVYGSTGDPRRFSKRAIFERMLAEEGLSGAQLLSFGDGPVELRETCALGGAAIGVCSDEEENGSGQCDPHKRTDLLAAGAGVMIPDYRDAVPLLQYLLS